MKYYIKNNKKYLSKPTAGEFILRADCRREDTGVAQPDLGNVAEEREWNIENKL